MSRMWVSLVLVSVKVLAGLLVALIRLSVCACVWLDSFKQQRFSSTQRNMAEDQAFIEEALPVQWKLCHRHNSRKTGCSNIFTGVNSHQLQRLYKAAGDRGAQHRAKLVWRWLDAYMEGAEEKADKEGEEREEETRGAQALVGLRVRARNRAGIRAEGHRDHKRLRTPGYFKNEQPLSDYSVEHEETARVPSRGEFLLPAPAEEDVPESQTPLKG